MSENESKIQFTFDDESTTKVDPRFIWQTRNDVKSPDVSFEVIAKVTDLDAWEKAIKQLRSVIKVNDGWIVTGTVNKDDFVRISNAQWVKSMSIGNTLYPNSK
jgi:hypothetical protein